MLFFILQITIQAEYELFVKFCGKLYDTKRFELLQRVSFSAMGSPYFNKKPEIMKVFLM